MNRTETKRARAARLAAWLAENATPAELAAILGPRWAICRGTPKNRERYGNCITPREYARAEAQALASRAQGEGGDGA